MLSVHRAGGIRVKVPIDDELFEWYSQQQIYSQLDYSNSLEIQLDSTCQNTQLNTINWNHNQLHWND